MLNQGKKYFNNGIEEDLLAESKAHSMANTSELMTTPGGVGHLARRRGPASRRPEAVAMVSRGSAPVGSAGRDARHHIAS